MSDSIEHWQKRLALAGAALFFIGGLTGILVGLSFGTDSVGSDATPVLLASHLNALMGCFWLAALGWSLPMASMESGRLALVCQLTILAATANWAVTLVKAFMGVHGVNYSGESGNDGIFIALTLTVVLPTLVASFFWMQGLWRGLKD
jgi:heme/copper-type cytochrome/quinol oxidase subunit 1